ncbi:MAG: hypothetical protein VYE40_19285 [Myxococcota bacterium]|jgi:hypothetical protein|nr:hypothetical protein [Myxococcota bacterium]MEC9443242.1 hypothetical protein [Myxococcota bacterium]
MADVTIRLVSNPKTGKRDIYIDYESEDDALPFEHEEDHRDVVEKLLGQGILDPDDIGQVKVGRVQPEAPKRESVTEDPEREKQSEQG